MEEYTAITAALSRRFETAMRKGRAVLFSAPCGFGKSTAARALLAGKRVLELSVDDPKFSLPPASGRWDVLLIDDLQWLADAGDQEALCETIRNEQDKQFVLLTRGTMPGWLIPFQAAGVLTVLGAWDLALDRESVGRLLSNSDIEVSDTELTSIYIESRGCPLPLSLLVNHLARGERYSSRVTDEVRRELFMHFEETVYNRLDIETRRLLLELAPFEPVTPEIAKVVSGSGNAAHNVFIN